MRKAKRYVWGLVLLGALALGGCAWLLRPLEAKLTAQPTSGPAPLSVTFSAAGSTGPIVSFTLNFGDGSPAYSGTDLTVNISHTYANPGTYTAVLTVQDAAGRTATDSKTITVLPGTTASLGVTPASGPAPLEVLFLVQANAASGRKIVYWKIDFGDGNAYEFTADTPSLTLPLPYEYNEPGTYTATLTVRDNTNFTATAQVTVLVTTPPPSASLEASPTSGSAPLSVTFSCAAAAGAGAKITKWVLQFGDGSFTGQEGLNADSLSFTVTHTYVQTGSYTAVFRVWDSLDQMGQDAATLEVGEAP
ncbi:MAG: PKD domain-containing protein [Candidatus Bipolaricaulaceae bacterium]